MQYRHRFFSISPYDALPAYMAKRTRDGRCTVYLKEDPASAFKGILRSRIETIATLCYLETVMRGEHLLPSALDFVVVRPSWTNGKFELPGAGWTVRLEFTGCGYQKAKWASMDARELATISGALC